MKAEDTNSVKEKPIVTKRKRAPIKVTLSDVERAYKKVEEFQRLIKRGKTPEQIFNDLVELIQAEK